MAGAPALPTVSWRAKLAAFCRCSEADGFPTRVRLRSPGGLWAWRPQRQARDLGL